MLQRTQENKVAARKRDGYRKNRKIRKQSIEERKYENPVTLR
jgi:hypothetical protein